MVLRFQPFLSKINDFIFHSRIRRAFNLAAYIGIFYLCNMYLLDITVSNSLNIDFKVKFSKAEFSSFMNQATEVGIFLGASSLFFASLMTFYKCINPINEYARALGTMRKLMNLIMSIFYISIAILMFLLSIPVS